MAFTAGNWHSIEHQWFHYVHAGVLVEGRGRGNGQTNIECDEPGLDLEAAPLGLV